MAADHARRVLPRSRTGRRARCRGGQRRPVRPYDQQQLAWGPCPATSLDLRAQLDAQSRASYGVSAADLTVARVVAATPPDYTYFSDTRYAVACGDQPTRSAGWYERLSDRRGPADPLYGWAYGITEPCGFWSDPPRQPLPDLPAQVASHVLVVQGEFDP